MRTVPVAAQVPMNQEESIQRYSLGQFPFDLGDQLLTLFVHLILRIEK